MVRGSQQCAAQQHISPEEQSPARIGVGKKANVGSNRAPLCLRQPSVSSVKRCCFPVVGAGNTHRATESLQGAQAMRGRARGAGQGRHLQREGGQTPEAHQHRGGAGDASSRLQGASVTAAV